MGTWGYYPKDSDYALDLQGIIGKKINKELEEMTNKHSGYEYSGLIMLLLQKGFFIKIKFIEKAIFYMEEMLEQTKNGNKYGWDNPEKAIIDITFLIYEFNKLLNDEKEFYLTSDKIGGKDVSKKSAKQRLNMYRQNAILAPRNWLARDFELQIGTSWSGLMEMHNIFEDE